MASQSISEQQSDAGCIGCLIFLIILLMGLGVIFSSLRN